MNNDLISRNALLACFKIFSAFECPCEHVITANHMIEFVENAPAAIAEPVQDGNIRHGSWIKEERNYYMWDFDVPIEATHWMPLPEPPKEET